MEALGDEPALISGRGRRPPDRRRVSMRWLAGSVLTGVTSVILMGGALYAALDGRQQLAQPANTVTGEFASGDDESGTVRGGRPVALVALQPVNEKILQVPTVTRQGDGNVIRKRPFAYASAPLAVAIAPEISYPTFNALTVFRASGSDNAVASSDVIYGADVESEVRMVQSTFPFQTANFDPSARISDSEAEQIIRESRNELNSGTLQIAALPYIDDTRFALKESDIAPTSSLDFTIVAENVTTVAIDDVQLSRNYLEKVIRVPSDQSLSAAMAGLKLDPGTLSHMIEAMAGELGAGSMARGTKLRVAWEEVDDITESDGVLRTCRRISVYRGGKHIKSVALNDDGSVVWATAPAPIPAIAADNDDKNDEIRMVARTNLPSVYDGIYRAALSQQLSTNQARRIVRTVAFDVDFKKVIKPEDNLEIFYSLEEGNDNATDQSEILYIGLTHGGIKRTYYRFKARDDGSVDYYDAKGKSAKKFLLRKPVPNSRFGSSFGPRRHPISRTYKMHWGVDFSAPRGTKILAAGNGVIEHAKWNSGYGRQVVIRHANGYKSSYSHMHRFAKGIRAGARVRQGQIIGQVGSTGYSTGPHLHYEVSVNGSKVNPMKIRLPKGRVLKGATLASFKRERDRINELLEKGRGTDERLAALN